MAKKPKRVVRKGQRVSAAEAERLNKIRQDAKKDVQPDPQSPQPTAFGIGAKIRDAREQRGLTWYTLAKTAGIPDPSTIRDIEYGRDAKLSNVEVIAAALDLQFDYWDLDRR